MTLVGLRGCVFVHFNSKKAFIFHVLFILKRIFKFSFPIVRIERCYATSTHLWPPQPVFQTLSITFIIPNPQLSVHIYSFENFFSSPRCLFISLSVTLLQLYMSFSLASLSRLSYSVSLSFLSLFHFFPVFFLSIACRLQDDAYFIGLVLYGSPKNGRLLEPKTKPCYVQSYLLPSIRAIRHNAAF
jgi:hypothetical protein